MKTTAFTLAAGMALTVGTASAETFVLVHGAFQTAGDWQGVAERLRAAGHEAIAVNLPGRGGDGRALAEVSLADHVATVSDTIATVEGPVVLVGHSFGGITISAVAETMPERIGTLVYVAAYLPQSGQSMLDLALMDHHNGFQADTFIVAPDNSHASLNPRDRVAVFAADAAPDLGQALADAMVDEPLPPIVTPVTLSADRFGTVRRAYVATLQDRTISPALQLTMIGRGGVDEVVPLPTGHAPQLVAPDDLVAALIAAATPEFE